MELKIAKLRKEKRVTQNDLAKHLGVSYQAVSKWETGATYPDISLLPKLSEYFGVSIDVLFGHHPARKEPFEMYDVIKNYLSGVKEEDIYDKGWKLTGVVHEGLCSKGWKSFVRWDMSKNRLADDSYEKWGVSINCEEEGFTHMTKGFSVFGDMKYIDMPKEEDIFKIARLFEKMSDRKLIKSLVKLYEIAADKGLDKPVTKDEILKSGIVDKDKADKLIESLIDKGFVNEMFSKDDSIVYKLDKGFIILPLLLMAKMLANVGVK